MLPRVSHSTPTHPKDPTQGSRSPSQPVLSAHWGPPVPRYRSTRAAPWGYPLGEGEGDGDWEAPGLHEDEGLGVGEGLHDTLPVVVGVGGDDGVKVEVGEREGEVEGDVVGVEVAVRVAGEGVVLGVGEEDAACVCPVAIEYTAVGKKRSVGARAGDAIQQEGPH
jgi:hypothetical protein